MSPNKKGCLRRTGLQDPGEELVRFWVGWVRQGSGVDI